MPRIRKKDQAGRFAKGRKHKNQWPLPSIWGSGRFAEQALDRWVTRHDCAGCGYCDRFRRVTRLRIMYARRTR